MRFSYSAMFAIYLGVMGMPTAPLAATQEVNCAAVARLATLIMRARQGGISLQNTLDTVKEDIPPEGYQTVRAIVVSAYEIQRFSDPAISLRTVEDFRDDVHVQCLKERPQ